MRGAPIVIQQRQGRQAGYESVPLKAHEDTYIPVTDAQTTTTVKPSDAPVEQQPQVQVAPANSQCCSCSYGPPG